MNSRRQACTFCLRAKEWERSHACTLVNHSIASNDFESTTRMAKGLLEFGRSIHHEGQQLHSNTPEFLEQMAISLANEAKRYAVENAVTPSKFAISEALESECEDHFDAILLLLGTLGLPVFKPLHAKESAQQNLDQVFWAKARGSSARGMMVDEGFVLLAGSQGPSSVTQSFSQRQRELRDKLVEQGTATTENGCYEIVQDLLLGSPSAASDIILGRSSNGWTEWKDDRGRTLDEVYRKTN